MKSLTIAVTVILVIMNTAAFILMLYDKRNAIKNKRRVPERTLFLAALLFGAFGGTLAMYMFRHKTKHWYFKVFFPLIMIAQACVIGYLNGREIL